MTLSSNVRQYDKGSTLVGGTPTRVVYLAPRAVSAVSHRTIRVVDRASGALADRLLDMGMADPVVGSLASIDTSKVTFVVAAHERPDGLARLLRSLESGRRVVVVDDCSFDVGAIAGVAAHHGAELMKLSVNAGPATARNTGLSLVTTPFVAFVDDDVVLDADCIPTLLKHFNDPKVALVSPRIGGLPEDAPRTWIQRYENARSSLDLGPNPSTVRPYAPVAWLPAACMVVRVDAIGEGFSADLRKGEDVDLVWRLAGEGWRVRYEPAAHAYHENRSNARHWLGRKAFYGSSGDLLARRHPRNMATAVLAPWNAGVAIALLAQRRWSLPVASTLTIIAATRIRRKARRSEQSARIGLELTATGVINGISQSSALMLRHWWPLTAIGCLLSRRMRRAALVLGVADAAIEYGRLSPELDPVRFAVARRLDDLAYGLGLWWGAIAGRSWRSLLPRVNLGGQGSDG